MEVDDLDPLDGGHFDAGDVGGEEVGIEEASEADAFLGALFDFWEVGVVKAECKAWELFEFFDGVEGTAGAWFACFCLGVELFDEEAGEDELLVKDVGGTEVDDAGVIER